MAKATLAWIAWRKGDKERACADAEDAMEIWSESVYPFKWNALWVLMALAADNGDNASVVKYARDLLDPGQQPLSPDLASSLASLTTAQGHEAVEIARQAVELAHRHKYL